LDARKLRCFRKSAAVMLAVACSDGKGILLASPAEVSNSTISARQAVILDEVILDEENRIL